MKNYSEVESHLKSKNYRWLITGAAGFIGSNLSLKLLELNQIVIGFDNFSSGKKENIKEIENQYLTSGRWSFIEEDICNYSAILSAGKGVHILLHQAAVGSVPRSIKEPLITHESNVNGFIKTIEAAKQNQIQKIVFASSSSVYGDHPALPKKEENVGEPLSPYAVSKKINEIYAKVYARCYSLPIVGLRYFNVFGPRQNSSGPYAAVIPLWIESLMTDKPVYINGDGSYSRDFCYIENVVQANLLAAMSGSTADGKIYNIAFGGRTNLNELYSGIQNSFIKNNPTFKQRDAVFREFRDGDIPHSHADINSAIKYLGYKPLVSAAEGLAHTVQYFIQHRRTR